MQKETHHENQQNEIFKIEDVQNILYKKGPTLSCSTHFSEFSIVLES